MEVESWESIGKLTGKVADSDLLWRVEFSLAWGGEWVVQYSLWHALEWIREQYDSEMRKGRR